MRSGGWGLGERRGSCDRGFRARNRSPKGVTHITSEEQERARVSRNSGRHQQPNAVGVAPNPPTKQPTTKQPSNPTQQTTKQPPNKQPHHQAAEQPTHLPRVRLAAHGVVVRAAAHHTHALHTQGTGGCRGSGEADTQQYCALQRHHASAAHSNTGTGAGHRGWAQGPGAGAC